MIFCDSIILVHHYRESHNTAEQALEYDEAFKEQLEKERDAFVAKVTK